MDLDTLNFMSQHQQVLIFSMVCHRAKLNLSSLLVMRNVPVIPKSRFCFKVKFCLQLEMVLQFLSPRDLM